MAIRLKYDAAAVVIPEDKSQQKFGQQLVQQQQKYANDQRQGMQERAYDQQKQFTQNAFQLQAAQTNRFFEDKRIEGQQAFAGKMQQNSLDARQQELKQRMDMAAQEQERQRVAQLKAQQRADDFEAMKSGGYDYVTASKLKDSYALETNIDLDGNLDAAMKAEAHAKNRAARSEYQKSRIPVPSVEDRYNEGVKYRDPNTGKLGSIQQPDSEIVNLNDGSSKSQKQQLPSSYEGYVEMDVKQSTKELKSAMEELRTKAEDSGKPYEDENKLRLDAYSSLKGQYDFMLGQIAASKKPLQPAAPGQAMAPPASMAPPAQQPAGMQDLEPTYNPDGTSNAPGGQPIQASPSEMSQPAPLLSQAATDVAVAAAAPDPAGKQPPPLPNEQAILATLFPQGVPADAPKSSINQPLALAPAHPDYKAPPTPTDQRDEKGYVIMSDGSKVDPRDSAAMKSGGREVQSVMRLTNPDGSPIERDLSKGVVNAEGGAKQAAQPKAMASIMDMIGEANKTFESGTPEQQSELRKKMRSSPDDISSLMAEAANGNQDAIKALDSMEKSIPLTDALRDKAKKGKSSDTNTIISELQTRRKLGEIGDKEYVSSVVSASGKPAKQIYEEIKKKTTKGGLGDNLSDRIERNNLNAIWDEMGMYDSRSYVRAFQKEPTMDDVIKHAVIKGKMSREKAEEWLYNQILGRSYADKLQKQFEDKLGGGADRRRETKQNEKSAAWKPN